MGEGNQHYSTGPADALLAEAYHQGRRARYADLAPSLNPHVPGSPEFAQWGQGWRVADGEIVSRRAA